MEQFELGETVLVHADEDERIVWHIPFQDINRETKEVIIAGKHKSIENKYIVVPWFLCWKIDESHGGPYDLDKRCIGSQGYYICGIYLGKLQGIIAYPEKYLELNSTPINCTKCNLPFIYVDDGYICSSCRPKENKPIVEVYSSTIISDFYGT